MIIEKRTYGTGYPLDCMRAWRDWADSMYTKGDVHEYANLDVPGVGIWSSNSPFKLP